jgi:hypothetical protein
MAGKGGRPRGSTGRSDRRLLVAFLEKRTLRFREAVDVTGLARGTVASGLRRFARNRFIVRSQGKRPIYKLTDQRGAWAYVLAKNLSEIRGRLKELERMRKRVGKSIRGMVRKTDNLRLKDQDTPATLRKFEEWAWSKVPPGMAYEDSHEAPNRGVQKGHFTNKAGSRPGKNTSFGQYSSRIMTFRST